MASPSPLPESTQTSGNWLTAKEAADALKLPLSTFYREKKRYGGLRRNGALMFDPALIAVAVREQEAKRAGDAAFASTVFKELEAGRSEVQIVIDHGIAPEVVERLAEAYARLKSKR
jgi:hypothetical protein